MLRIIMRFQSYASQVFCVINLSLLKANYDALLFKKKKELIDDKLILLINHSKVIVSITLL